MVGLTARLAGRKAVLVDLSPAATSIGAAHCRPIDTVELKAASQLLVNRLRKECGSLYEVVDEKTLLHAEVDYVIWSEQYRCSNCLSEFLFAEAGYDLIKREPRSEVHCPKCDALLIKRGFETKVVGIKNNKCIKCRNIIKGVYN